MDVSSEKAKVGLFSQNVALVEICRTEVERLGAHLDVYASFVVPSDAALQAYRLILVDVEHPDESGVHYLERVREFPALKSTPVLLLSSFMTDTQADVIRKKYPESTQIMIRVPLSLESFRSLMSYYLSREKSVGASPVVEASMSEKGDELSLKELYERQVEKEYKADVLGNVVTMAEQKPSVYEEKDIDALHHYLELRDKDIYRLSEALNRAHDRLNQAYATIDHLRVEIGQLKQDKESSDVKHLTIKDDFERFKMNTQREKQALIEDYQIKLAYKEVLEGGYKEAKTRLEEFKKRVQEEVKIVRRHERELEQKLQILKADTDVLVQAKDGRILELTKKVEELYDHIGRLNDRIRRSEQTVEGQHDRQGRVLKALRLASSLLEEENEGGVELEEKAS